MGDTVEDDFAKAIHTHFGFLFQDHGFVLVTGMYENVTEYQMQIAASAHCQIKFTLERGYFEIRFGASDVPRLWGNDAAGTVYWHSAASLIRFEDHVNPGNAMRPPPLERQSTLEQALTFYSRLLSHYAPALIAMFAHAAAEDVWQSYEAFRRA